MILREINIIKRSQIYQTVETNKQTNKTNTDPEKYTKNRRPEKTFSPSDGLIPSIRMCPVN